MHPDDYKVFHEKLCEEARELSMRKGSDYSTGGSTAHDADTLRNLKMTERVGITTGPRGVLVRIQDKVSRLAQLLPRESEDSQAQVKDESVGDTIVDLINYSVLLAALIEDASSSALLFSPEEISEKEKQILKGM